MIDGRVSGEAWIRTKIGNGKESTSRGMRGIVESRDNKRSGQFWVMSNHSLSAQRECVYDTGRGSRTAGSSWSRAKTQCRRSQGPKVPEETSYETSTGYRTALPKAQTAAHVVPEPGGEGSRPGGQEVDARVIAEGGK